VPLYSHQNQRLDTRSGLTQNPKEKAPSGAYLASYDVEWELDYKCRNHWDFESSPFPNPSQLCPKTDNNFIGIAISGGGSRSAVFSAAVFFELQRYGILQQVDVITSVSGGSLTAAYYTLSCDQSDNQQKCPPTVEGPQRVIWEPKEVFSDLEKNFIGRWIGNWFWPDNILRYWFTYYDRTDVMVETFSDNLFDNSLLGGEGFRFHDLNPQRPFIIINATNNTRSNIPQLNFTFTDKYFNKIKSSLAQYPIANAVMASAAFPAAFNYNTLRNFSADKNRYVHLFDGGTSDNLGLSALEEVLSQIDALSDRQRDKKIKLLVILIDAYKPIRGKSSRDPDPRSVVDYFFDTNFMDAYDTLMAEMRDDKIDKMRKLLNNDDSKSGKLIHVKFDDLIDINPNIFRVVKHIDTSFKIGSNEANCLKHAARFLVESKMKKLMESNSWSTLVQDPPSEAYQIEPCLQQENHR
jgi:predicted acylesterase/phospholipase RssA